MIKLFNTSKAMTAREKLFYLFKPTLDNSMIKLFNPSKSSMIDYSI